MTRRLTSTFLLVLGMTLAAPGAQANAEQDRPAERLLTAVARGDTELVATLLDAGADPHDVRGGFGQAPLQVAIQNGHAEIVRLLLAHIDDIDAGAGASRTPPLFMTVGHLEFADMIFARGADVNVRNKSGDSVMHFAILDPPSANYFLARGAKINARNERDVLPVHVAAENGSPRPRDARR